MGFASKAQSKKMYDLWRQGKISYAKLQSMIHSTPDMQKLPDRITPKKGANDKTTLAVKGLV